MDMEVEDIFQEFDLEASKTGLNKSNTIQSQQDIKRLVKSWISERMAPEILQYEEDLLDRIFERLRDQIEYIEINSMDMDVVTEKDIKLHLMIVESEVDRINYLIRGYLRMRLAKIDKCAMFIKGSASQYAKLSSGEVDYMNKHLEILHELYSSQFLSNLPSELQTVTDPAIPVSIEVPDLDKAVFIRVIKTIPRILTVGKEDVELEEGSIYCMRYSAIRQYISEGQVELI